MKIPFVVVAGGQGLRMGSKVPKQYIEVEGKPIIWHTVKNLFDAGVRKFIIVMNMEYLEYLKNHLEDIDADISYVPGGRERFESVRNGIEALDEGSRHVAIHDSVRPLISKKLLKRLYEEVERDEASGVIPVLQPKDTLKIVNLDMVESTIRRDSVRRAGTPQIVKVEDYKQAAEKLGNRISEMTDDASVLEAAGKKVATVEGEEESFKITDSIDLDLFKLLLRRKYENRDRI